MEHGVKVHYAKRETGWVAPIAKSKKGMIAIATNNPIMTKKFHWGDLVMVNKKGEVTKKVSSIPNTKSWKILRHVI